MNVDDFRIKTEVTAPVTIFDVYAETLETWA